jgi:hypothetical protein
VVAKIWVVVAALGFSRSWSNAIIVDGGVKFVAIVFAFVPGQFGASEGTYALLVAVGGVLASAPLAFPFFGCEWRSIDMLCTCN